jgi:hypothetical protein
MIECPRMAHPLVLGLFEDRAAAAHAARALRELGLPRHSVSIVARTHDEEGTLARAADATPGVEIEDSQAGWQLGELSAHLLSAIALVMPGIGPIVADGPLAADLGEAAGHLAGGISKTLVRAGLPRAEATAWESRIEGGAVLLGAHTDDSDSPRIVKTLEQNGATQVAVGTWSEPND